MAGARCLLSTPAGTAPANVSHQRPAIIDILDGSLDNAETFTLPMFNLQIPTELPGVDTHISTRVSTVLRSRQEKADQLAKLFIENSRIYAPAGAALVAAGPKR